MSLRLRSGRPYMGVPSGLYLWLAAVLALIAGAWAGARAQPVDRASEPSCGVSLSAAGGRHGGAGMGPAPMEHLVLGLKQLAQGDAFVLDGLANTQYLEFTVRKDREVERARLDLVFTPSPFLQSQMPHVRVYLNDELMGVVIPAADQQGTRQRHSIVLDPRLITSSNRIRLEFIARDADSDSDSGNSALWLDLSRDTQLLMDQKAIAFANDLAYFPEPFFDPGSMQTQVLPFVFSQAPDPVSLQAAGVLASYFGSLAKQQTLRFPVLYGQMPARHAVVFADNQHRPGFLKSYPPVDAPTVGLVSAPGNPYQKLLLVLGRNPGDLLVASQALALGSPLLRGRSVRIPAAVALAPRRPYDAPAWIPTDRPVLFSELEEYPGQLEAAGVLPPPISLTLNLPPDLFIWRNAGIPLQLRYRYTAPPNRDGSSLSLSINHQFVKSLSLRPDGEPPRGLAARMPVLEDDSIVDTDALHIPASEIAADNQLRFEFSYASYPGNPRDRRHPTLLPADLHASIDRDSVIDFSGYPHYLAMPDLKAFARSGFPFSRMADLSETVVVVPPAPRADLAAAVLETVARVSEQTGLPASKVRMTSDRRRTEDLDADVLWFGEMAGQMRNTPDGKLVLEGAHSVWRVVHEQDPARRSAVPDAQRRARDEAETAGKVVMEAQAPLAAIVEMRSLSHPQRSWVGLLASSRQDFRLLRDALADSSERAAMQGGVVFIRSSGVYGAQVGPRYFVGYLPWWAYGWYMLSHHPASPAVLTIVLVVALIILLCVTLWGMARPRQGKDE